MIRNYIVIAWRSLLHNRLFSFINIFGLALSMCVCMMILLRIIDNFNFDTFHPQAKQTYRIISGLTFADGNKVDLATTPFPLQESLEAEAGVIQRTVNLYPALNGTATDGIKEFHISGAFTQPSFFEVFGFTLKYGNTGTSLASANSIIITDELAHKFFGDINPLGKTISFLNLGDFQITGVLNTPEAKSHIHFEAYASWATVSQLEKENKLPSIQTSWDTFEKSYTYVLLQEGVGEHTINAGLASVAASFNKASEKVKAEFIAQPISSITPGWKQLYHETSRGTSWAKLITEVGIGLIILIAACFNYTNLSIARALTRGKEVGIRKLSGAMRWQIFLQYIIEAVMISLFALCLAQVFLSFILQYKPFNDGYEMIPTIALSVNVWLIFLVFAVFAGIIAGAAPAWILSAFKPVRVLKSIGTEKIMGNLSLRKVLMVFQFSLSLVILIFLTAFYKQFDYIESAETGFARKDIMIVPSGRKQDILAAEFSRINHVEKIGFTSDHFGSNPSGSIEIFENKSLKNYQKLGFYFADAAYVEIMGLEIISGNNFSSTINSNQVLLNEKAAKQLGFQNSSDAVGQTYYLQDSSSVEVIGVIKDFYQRSAGHMIESIMLRNQSSGFKQMIVKVSGGNAKSLEASAAAAWKKVYPEDPFVYEFLDKKLTDWNNQSATISLLGFLSFMTITIASMGLLGMVVYTVETRRKEISIRKIVGSQVSQLIVLLSKGYLKLLLISGLIALPLGYALSQFFLMNFANKVAFGIGHAALSFILLLLIGLTTILSQTLKAANENPARNLRSE